MSLYLTISGSSSSKDSLRISSNVATDSMSVKRTLFATVVLRRFGDSVTSI